MLPYYWVKQYSCSKLPALSLGRLKKELHGKIQAVFFFKFLSLSCVRPLIARRTEALGLHEKQLIMCLVESLTKLDFDSDWCACTQVEYNGRRLWMILKGWLLCGDYIFVVYNCRRPPAGSIYIVSQFDPLPAVEISDTRRSLVLTKKPQLRRSNSFSDTKCPNSIIIQLIEQDILRSVVVQRVILSFFF